MSSLITPVYEFIDKLWAMDTNDGEPGRYAAIDCYGNVCSTNKDPDTFEEEFAAELGPGDGTEENKKLAKAGAAFYTAICRNIQEGIDYEKWKEEDATKITIEGCIGF